ncbi:fermentative D-lactate dehydrogenase, NAD-dependent [Haemophilus influenzae]|uniref:Fermentative D-lactate dehydrogenase, NAD-dependent n=1 Tax=Haemophilus influenzae TaxID=727 RepID=A0A2X1PUW1_HAEIF|nr:fermentative D-lactate dehydrogenase, NAD-dependent [Haemophilus influenzae]
MKIAIYSTKNYDRKYIELINAKYNFDLEFFDFMLNESTVRLAEHCEVVCIFVNDNGSRKVLEKLAALGVKIVALRCAGFNNVDLKAAQELGIQVVRVPAYSPEAVAEHTIGLMMTLNRRIHRAYQRTREANFSLEGLIGFNMYGRTVGRNRNRKNRDRSDANFERFWHEYLGVRSFQKSSSRRTGGQYVELDELYAKISCDYASLPSNARKTIIY